MTEYKITKGLDLPIAGKPKQEITDAEAPTHVALLGVDYVGMKPTMHVAVGDQVSRGQLLFGDKKTAGVRFTAPAAGRVTALNRGERRVFQSLVIELDEAERSGDGKCVAFESYSGRPPGELDREQVQSLLLESGLWTSLRRRPFSRAADPGTPPEAIFVTAMDTNPLAADVGVAMAGREQDFAVGLEALTKLTDGPLHLCRAPGGPGGTPGAAQVSVAEFRGPHPAGLAGVHIHFIRPVNAQHVVWYVNYQDVLAIGALFSTGELDVSRITSLAGPAVSNPRLLRTRIGASVDDLTRGELKDGQNRIVSGSVLSGRAAQGDVLGYLGRFHLQVMALPEGGRREVLGWLGPGFTKFSTKGVYASHWLKGAKFNFTTTTNGSDRSMVPIGMYEKVMPMDLEPTFLLRALLTQDIERAVELGVLELDEEDLALCTFVCPGKSEYGPLLRRLLTTIEKEG